MLQAGHLLLADHHEWNHHDTMTPICNNDQEEIKSDFYLPLIK